jgi:hypothetical protein
MPLLPYQSAIFDRPNSTFIHLANSPPKIAFHSIRWCAFLVARGWQVWKAPALITQFSPFALLRTYTGHHDDILSIEWTPDSQYENAAMCSLSMRVSVHFEFCAIASREERVRNTVVSLISFILLFTTIFVRFSPHLSQIHHYLVQGPHRARLLAAPDAQFHAADSRRSPRRGRRRLFLARRQAGACVCVIIRVCTSYIFIYVCLKEMTCLQSCLCYCY